MFFFAISNIGAVLFCSKKVLDLSSLSDTYPSTNKMGQKLSHKEKLGLLIYENSKVLLALHLPANCEMLKSKESM